MTLIDTSSLGLTGAFVLGTLPLASETGALISVRGTTLLHAPNATPAAVEAGLKSLRGFRTNGRRVVWCNATELTRAPKVDLAAWGRKLVELGQANMVIMLGVGGRDMAVAARDAGLPIGRVVVCGDDVTARNLLGDSIRPGDAILALGIAADSCYKLAERLESRFEREALVTA
jgi:hypothetical protein